MFISYLESYVHKYMSLAAKSFNGIMENCTNYIFLQERGQIYCNQEMASL